MTDNFEEVRTEGRSCTGFCYTPEPKTVYPKWHQWFLSFLLVATIVLVAIYGIVSLSSGNTDEKELGYKLEDVQNEDTNWSLEYIDKTPVWRKVYFPLDLSMVDCKKAESMSIYMQVGHRELTGNWGLTIHGADINYKFSGDTLEQEKMTKTEPVTCYPKEKYGVYQQDEKSFCVRPKDASNN